MTPELGFGLMRLPVLADGKVDDKKLFPMVDLFLDRSFTYFDTAYPYLNGESEKCVRRALSERHDRSKFRLATKMTVSLLKEKSDVEKIFLEQLDRTRAEYFDCYLLHAVDNEKLARLDELRLWDFLSDLKAKGLAKSIGFSFHDTAQVLDKILTSHPEVDFVQLQLNYADWKSPSVQSEKCWAAARKHGKEIKVMEPVKGGMLASGLNEKAAKVFRDAAPNVTLPEWALSFVAGLDGVQTVLSGMSDLAQVDENTRIFSNPGKNLPENKDEIFKQVAAILESIPTVPCTKCSYCTSVCPKAIPIPNLIGVLNNTERFGTSPGVVSSYNWYSRRVKPSECISCGNCKKQCPQHIDIPSAMKRLAEKFSKA